MNDAVTPGPPPAPVAIRVEGHGRLPINVWDYGGDGPPLVLCHCTGAVARVWDPVIGRLCGRYRPIAIDTRGHGDSGRPAQRADYAWAHSGRDILAAVDSLCPGTGLWAVGHSGGAAHIAYAALQRPGVFSRAVLIEAIVGPPEAFEGDSTLADNARRRRNTFESRADARRRFRSKPPMNTWHEEALEAYVQHGLTVQKHGGVHLKLPGEIEAFCYEMGGAHDVYDQLAQMSLPALLVAGSESNCRFLVAGQAARMPAVQERIVAGAGHFIPQERPATTAGLIDGWFGNENCEN
ncbi:MAG: alpha/beta fold hydrolase [Candidatus Hydrogenedentota bacterium]